MMVKEQLTGNGSYNFEVSSETHCKITVFKEYFEMMNVSVGWLDLFLLGLDDFLELGLEKICGQYLLFLIPYSFSCDEKIIERLEIPVRWDVFVNIEDIKNAVDSGRIVGLYFDNSMRKSKKRVFNEVKSPFLAEGKMKKSSMGLIKGYDDNYLYTNLRDIDNGLIKVPLEAIDNKTLSKEVVELLPYDKKLSEDKIKQIIGGVLFGAGSRHIKLTEAYEYEEESGKYGTVGVNCLAALNGEIKKSVELFKKTGSESYLTLLIQKINVLRIYATKGSSSFYRQELADSVSRLQSYFSIPEDRADTLREKLVKAARSWRRFSRFLFNVNFPFFRMNIDSFVEKMTKELNDIYEQELQIGKEFVEIFHDWE